MQKKFSRWVRWEKRNELTGIKFPGVYAIAKTHESLEGLPFRYIEEIVYFGMSNSKGGLRQRLQQFNDTMAGVRDQHGGADRFLAVYKNFARLKPRLYVSVCFAECDVTSLNPRDLLLMGEVAKWEYECWASYVKRYGCLPRFNNKKDSPKIARERPWRHGKV